MLGSRAVVRIIQPGNWVECAGCGETLKFRARLKRSQVIANCYEGDRWDRVEHWHPDCYDLAGQPYGVPLD